MTELDGKVGQFYKIRDKGWRGVVVYKRTFSLDLEAMVIRYSPHRGEGAISLQDIGEVRPGLKTDTLNKIEARPSLLARTDIEHFNESMAFSIIFKPETNMRELDLLAEDVETQMVWVGVIRDLVTRFGSCSNEETYEMSVDIPQSLNLTLFFSFRFLKNKFQEADRDNSKQLSFEEVKSLCRSLNIKISKDEMRGAFNESRKKKKRSLQNSGQDYLDENEFVDFYHKLMRRPEVDELFDKYTKEENEVSLKYKGNINLYFSRYLHIILHISQNSYFSLQFRTKVVVCL